MSKTHKLRAKTLKSTLRPLLQDREKSPRSWAVQKWENVGQRSDVVQEMAGMTST